MDILGIRSCGHSSRFCIGNFAWLGRLAATVSNVRGPREQLYADSVPVVDLYSLSVLSTGQGLNLTGWSYLDYFVVGIVSCPELEPELWKLADGLPVALDELRHAALERLKKINDKFATISDAF